MIMLIPEMDENLNLYKMNQMIKENKMLVKNNVDVSILLKCSEHIKREFLSVGDFQLIVFLNFV